MKDFKKSFLGIPEKLIKDGVLMGIRQIAIMAIGLAFTVLFTRIASKETFGQYQLILSIIATVSIVSVSGLNTSVLQAVARGYEGTYKKAVGMRFRWSLLGIPVLLTIGSCYIINQQLELGYLFLLSSAFFPFLYSTNTWESYLQGKEKFDTLTKYSIIRAFFSSALLIASLVTFQGKLLPILFSYLLSISLSNYLFHRKVKEVIKTKKEDPDSVKYGWFLTKISAMNSIFSKVDYLLVGYFIGIEGLAIYSIGISLGMKIKDLFKVIFSVLSPKIARRGFNKIKNYILLFLVFSFLSIIIYYILPTAVRVLYSAKYENSIHIAQIFISFLPFFIVGLLLDNHLSFFSKNKKVILFTNALAPIAKFLLMLLMLKTFKEEGLAAINGFYPAIRMALIFVGFRLFGK